MNIVQKDVIFIQNSLYVSNEYVAQRLPNEFRNSGSLETGKYRRS